MAVKSKKSSTRARAASSNTSKKTSTRTPSKSSSKTKTKARNTGPAKSNRGPAKKTAAKKVSKVAAPAKKTRGGVTREMDEVTGFAIGTDSHIIAEALVEGGESRQDIIEYLRENMNTETRNGTEKPVANLVSAIINKMLDRGFTVESSYRLVPPVASVKGSRKRK